jgi:hypothetical protein
MSKCSGCGKSVGPDDLFCGECGHNLNTDFEDERAAENIHETEKTIPPVEIERSHPPALRPRQVVSLVKAQFVYAGIAVLIGAGLLVDGIVREEPIICVGGIILLLAAVTGVLVAWAMRCRKRWAYLSGLFLVLGFLPVWPIVIAFALMEDVDMLTAPGWIFLLLCFFTGPASTVIVIFLLLQPVRDWFAKGSEPDGASTLEV